MKKLTLTIGAALAAVATAAPAVGGPVSDDNQFEGLVERDSRSYIGFDARRVNGNQRITNVAARLPFHCSTGFSSRERIVTTGSLRVENRRFAGKLRANFANMPLRGAVSDMTVRIRGKLGKRGRAVGRIRSDFRFSSAPPPRGEPTTGHCYTGWLDWRARRGLEIPFVILD